MSIYLVDPTYNPNFFESITSSTKVGPGIPIAKFLGAPGSRTQFDQITEDTRTIARQLYLQAEAIRLVQKNSDFNQNRLTVSEGIYVPAITESPSGINKNKMTGKSIVYQLMAPSGQIDIEKSFDLAVSWKDYAQFDELVLDYDTYDPDGSISCQIVLTMPECTESFDINFSQKIQTDMNGELLSANELVEVLE